MGSSITSTDDTIVVDDTDGFPEKYGLLQINNEIITGGMIPKINNCLDVASNGVKGVVIIDGRKKILKS